MEQLASRKKSISYRTVALSLLFSLLCGRVMELDYLATAAHSAATGEVESQRASYLRCTRYSAVAAAPEAAPLSIINGSLST
jgi:hypothetical protein